MDDEEEGWELSGQKIVVRSGKRYPRFEMPPDRLREIFDEHSIVKSGKPPNDWTFRALAGAIEDIESRSFHHRGDWKVAIERSRRLADAAKTITELVPLIVDEPEGGGPSPSALRTMLLANFGVDAAKLMDTFREALTHVQTLEARLFKTTVHWHDYVLELAEVFRSAMRFTDPKFDPKPSNTGVFARFLVVIIPMISQEKPKANAIIRYMTRAQDKAPDGNTTN